MSACKTIVTIGTFDGVHLGHRYIINHLNKIAKKVDNEYEESMIVDFEKKDDKITLSFILNIIDGIRETPGRIMIITSNDYESLDPALIRPGRIDYNIHFDYATKNQITKILNYYFNDEDLTKQFIQQIKGIKLTTCVLQKYLFENRISYYWNYKYNLKKSFTKANTSSASYIIIIGENEFNGDFFTIKNLMNGEQKELKLNQIFNHLNDKSR